MLSNYQKSFWVFHFPCKIVIPLFNSQNISSFAAINLPYCHTPESYRHTEKVAEMLFFFGQWNPNQCNCQQQCMKMLYTSSLESTTDRFKITKGRTKARVRIYYQVRIDFFEIFSPQFLDFLCNG